MVEEIQQPRSKRSEDLRSVADLLFLEAWKRGYKEGWEQGFQEGRQLGIKEGLQLALERLVASGICEEEAREWLGLD